MDDNMFNMKIDLCEALGLDPNKVTGLSVYVPRLGPPMVEASYMLGGDGLAKVTEVFRRYKMHLVEEEEEAGDES